MQVKIQSPKIFDLLRIDFEFEEIVKPTPSNVNKNNALTAKSTK